jgi:CHASE1-domain containing sensor protein
LDNASQVSVVTAGRYESTRALVRDFLRSRLVWLSLAVTLAATLGWAWMSVRHARETARRDFEQRSRVAAAQVEQSFRAPLEALYSIHALGGAWPDIDQKRFELFAAKLMERYPSLAALELFDVVRGEDRADFERRVSAQIGRPFSFQEPASDGPARMVVSPPRDRHVVLTRLLPYQADLHGLDITFEAVRRGQIEAAARAGKPLVTGKFRLVEDPEGVHSVAVYDPLYRHGEVPATSEERDQRLRGFAIALYRLSPLMQAALAGTNLNQFGVALLDLEPGLSGPDSLLFGTRARPLDIQFRHEIFFAGRAWALETSRAAPAALTTALPVLLMGGIGSLLLTMLVGLSVTLRKSRSAFVPSRRSALTRCCARSAAAGWVVCSRRSTGCYGVVPPSRSSVTRTPAKSSCVVSISRPRSRASCVTRTRWSCSTTDARCVATFTMRWST